MSNNWGLTQREIADIKASGAGEISLFINGREFMLEGITLDGTTTLREALVQERDELADLVEHRLAKFAEDLEMTLSEARMFLGAQGLYLDRLIGG